MENYTCLTVCCRNLDMNNARDRAFSALSPFLFARTRLRTAPARWHSRPSTSRLKSLGNAFAARVALLPKWPPAELQLSNTITQGDGNRVQANSPSASSLSCPAAQIPYHTQKHECPMAIHAILHSRHRAFFVCQALGATDKKANELHNRRACSALQGIGGLGPPTSEVQEVKRLHCLPMQIVLLLPCLLRYFTYHPSKTSLHWEAKLHLRISY